MEIIGFPKVLKYAYTKLSSFKKNRLNKKVLGIQIKKTTINSVLYLKEKNNRKNDKWYWHNSVFRHWNIALYRIFTLYCIILIFQKPISLLKCLFKDRNQPEKISSKFLDEIAINHGGPQGTVIGHLVFSHMKKERDFDMVRVADETKLLYDLLCFGGSFFVPHYMLNSALLC